MPAGEGVLGIIVPDVRYAPKWRIGSQNSDAWEVSASWDQTDTYAAYCVTAGMACIVLACLQYLYFEVCFTRSRQLLVI